MKKISFFFAALAVSAMTFAATFKKVTSVPADWSGEYILVYEVKADTGYVFSGVDQSKNGVGVHITTNTIEGEFTTLVIDTITKGSYSIQIKGGTNDGKYISGTNNSNKTNFDDKASAVTLDIKDNSVSIVSNTSVMRFNKASGYLWFRFFKASSYTNQQPVQLYKLKKETKPTLVDSIGLKNDGKDTIEVADKLDLNSQYTIFPDTATDQRVEFSIVEGATYVSLSDGVITGLAAGDAQIKITAIDSLNNSAKKSAIFQIHVKAAVLNTCAEVNAAAKDDVLKLNTVTVSYVNGANVYVQDASGSTLVYMFDSGLKAGDVVSGIKGKAAPYNGLPELKPSNAVTDWTITASVAPTFPDATAAPAADQVNKIFTYKGVTGLDGSFDENTRSLLTGKFLTEDFNLYNNFKQAATFDKTKTYDVVGAVGIINNTDVRVFFISATEATPTAINTAEADKAAVKKLILNGQVVFLKDGKTFNALGVEL